MKKNTSLWQCLVSQNSSCVILDILFSSFEVNNSDDAEKTLKKQIEDSIDIYSYCQAREVSVRCHLTDKFLTGQGRKFQHYFDLRIFSESKFCELVSIGLFELAFSLIPSPATNNVRNKVIRSLTNIPFQTKYSFAKFLTKIWTKKARGIGDFIFADCASSNRKYVIADLQSIAMDEDWEVREEAAKLYSIFLISDFSKNFHWISANLRSTKENLRRAALLGMKYASLKISDVQKLKKLVDALDCCLFDTSKYVKKSFDSFTIGDGFLNRCPDLVEKKLEKWFKLNNPHVDAIILRTFMSSGGTRTWPLARKFLVRYSTSTDLEVVRAFRNTCKYLEVRIPDFSLE